MALGRKSENQAPQIPGSALPPVPSPPVPPMPPMPPTPASPIDTSVPQQHAAVSPQPSGADVVTALDARLAELQATVAALVDKAVDSKLASTPAAHVGDLEIDADVLESS